MKSNVNQTILLIILLMLSNSLMSFKAEQHPPPHIIKKEKHPDPDEKKALAFQVLQTNCNLCHRKQNPFMVFNPKNMEKRAKRINQAVFVDKRMPKGDEIKLTQEESNILKQWLNTQNLK